MPEENPNGGGNEIPSDGEPQVAETQAPESESPAAGSNEPDWKREFLQKVKPVQEEANRLRRELEELRRERSPSPVASDPVDSRGRKPVTQWAAEGDTVAEATVHLAREVQFRDQRDEIEDPVLRKAAWKHFEENRHRLGDVPAALNEVRARRMADIEQENARLKAQLQARSKPPATNNVPTSDREAPSTPTTTTMTAKQWNQEQKSLTIAERLARQRLANEGKIVIED